MFRNCFVRFKPKLRLSCVCNNMLHRKTLSCCDVLHKRSSALLSMSWKEKLKVNPNHRRNLCLTNICNSNGIENNNSGERQESRSKTDPEIRAWMNQIAQDSEKEPFYISNDEKELLFTSKRVMDVDSMSAFSMADQKQTNIEIEEFGYLEDDEEEYEEEVFERHIPVSLDRGETGVFNVEEMVTALEHENGLDIQVIDIPPEIRFVDHMVVVSGKSLRHMRAMAASIEWLYKRKKKKGDRPFKLEGRDCRDWFAMDLGNIAVHIFTPEARQHYDIETLWRLGPEHDDKRHYVEDDHLNLSAADLFWLETGVDSTTSNSEVQGSTENGSVYGGENISMSQPAEETFKTGVSFSASSVASTQDKANSEKSSKTDD